MSTQKRIKQSFTVDPDTLAKIQAIANRENNALSRVIELALRDFIDADKHRQDLLRGEKP
jgi:predicted transcriptional regulator